MDRPCQIMFGQVRGDKIHAIIEDALGAACPCFSDLPCVLLRDDGTMPLTRASTVPVEIPMMRIASVIA